MGGKSSKKKKAFVVDSDTKFSNKEKRVSARQEHLQIVDASTPSASDAD